ncbi:hypothetical protein ACWGNE_02360 [Streptomyces xiamenensis]|uniref:hypothetical protein n=1 Tax=Streptomyces xiamenensis TaxID=408015 RepID=UPI0035E1BCE8
MTDMTPAQMRARAESDLRPLGDERLKLNARLAEIDAEIEPLVLRARQVEVTEERIRQLTGISRGKIRKMEGKAPK